MFRETSTTRSTRFRLAAGIQWAVESDGVLVTNGTGMAHRIGYPEAAVWDWMTRGYPLEKVLVLIGYVASLEPSGARELVAEALCTWDRMGLLTTECPDG
jgi:hypothetical protein